MRESKMGRIGPMSVRGRFSSFYLAWAHRRCRRRFVLISCTRPSVAHAAPSRVLRRSGVRPIVDLSRGTILLYKSGRLRLFTHRTETRLSGGIEIGSRNREIPCDSRVGGVVSGFRLARPWHASPVERPRLRRTLAERESQSNQRGATDAIKEMGSRSSWTYRAGRANRPVVVTPIPTCPSACRLGPM